MDRRLHIGGKQKNEGWEVLNVVGGPHLDHLADARDLSQFQDQTFSSMYASHVVEHFDYSGELENTLKEWYRVLKPGGSLYVSVPDMDVLSELFLAKDKLTLTERFQVMRMIFGGHVDKHDYHQVGLNEEILCHYLGCAGYTNIRRVDRFGIFADTSSMELKGTLISLNLVAERPTGGRPEKTEDISIAIEQAFPGALHTLGIVAQGYDKTETAVHSTDRTMAPDYAEACNSLGNTYAEQRDYDKAESMFRRAVEANPGFPEALSNLGNILNIRGNLEEAETNYRKAIDLMPDFMDAYNGLGEVLKVQGRQEEAEASYRKAIALSKDDEKPYSNLGSLLMDRGRLAEAEENFRKAIEINPEFGNAYNNLSILLMLQGKAEEALHAQEKVLALKPDSAIAHSNLLLSMNYLAQVTSKEIFEESLRWDRRHGAPRAGTLKPHENDRDSERRLRIGYVSSDFRQHSVSYFFEPLLAAHHRDKVNTFCYANVVKPDATTMRMQLLSHRWRNCVGLSDKAVVDRIRKDRIDILVDLSGHTGHNRLTVFAEKSAPIQVTWLGYPNTTGMQAMDYRITDAIADPEGVTDSYYSEKLYRLSGGFLCYAPPKDAPDVSPTPAIVNGFVTFGSFNNLAKVTPHVIELWAALLERVQGSRLFLKNKSLADNSTCDRYRKMLAHHGIDPSRIDMGGMVNSTKDHLALYGGIDIALDTYPYSGTTTTCEALWMGVPVITLLGDRHAGRVGASILTGIGLDGLIAQAPEEYLEIAVRLGGDPASLALLRNSLRERLKRSLLCDAESFAAKMEEAYREMWRGWCVEDGK